jgi:hypothetical protein
MQSSEAGLHLRNREFSKNSGPKQMPAVSSATDFDRAQAQVATGEHAGHARFKKVRIAIVRPAFGCRHERRERRETKLLYVPDGHYLFEDDARFSPCRRRGDCAGRLRPCVFQSRTSTRASVRADIIKSRLVALAQQLRVLPAIVATHRWQAPSRGQRE